MADEAQGNLLTETSSPETTSTETTSWFSEENKEVVERCGWKDPNDVLASYRNLEKSASGKIKMPTPESSAEEIRAFYQKTGCPENPEGYEITDIPEGLPRNEDVEKAMCEIAHEEGVSKQAFEHIMKGYYDKMQADLAAGRVAGEKQLREDFGDKYDENMKIAKRFCGTCSDEFMDLLVTTGLGNNPVFVKEFFEKGKQILSDTLIKGDGGGGEQVDKDYKPASIKSPGMYANGTDEESIKARAWFRANKNYDYGHNN